MPIFPIKNINKDIVSEGYSTEKEIVYINKKGKEYKWSENGKIKFLTSEDKLLIFGEKLFNQRHEMIQHNKYNYDLQRLYPLGTLKNIDLYTDPNKK